MDGLMFELAGMVRARSGVRRKNPERTDRTHHDVMLGVMVLILRWHLPADVDLGKAACINEVKERSWLISTSFCFKHCLLFLLAGSVAGCSPARRWCCVRPGCCMRAGAPTAGLPRAK